MVDGLRSRVYLLISSSFVARRIATSLFKHNVPRVRGSDEFAWRDTSVNQLHRKNQLQRVRLSRDSPVFSRELVTQFCEIKIGREIQV